MDVSYKILGIPMQRQSTRRKMVVMVYALLLAFCIAGIVFARTEPQFYRGPLYAALAVAALVFGGSGKWGLIKPFPNKPPWREPVIVDVVRSQLKPMALTIPDQSGWTNDERELARRDRAHYLAYQAVTIVLVLVLPVAAFGLRAAIGLHHPDWLTVTLALHVIYALALVGSVMAVTLPAAIILWNEPDMDLD
jgi:cation transporter-like permease